MTMRTGHTRRNLQRVAIAAGIAVALSSCSGDSPESIEGALSEAAPTLAFVEEAEGACVANAISRHVGFDDVIALGYTTRSIEESPAEAIAEIFDSNDSSDLRDEVTECLDVDAMVRQQLVALNNGELTCTSTFTSETAFVETYLDDRFSGGDDLTIDDTSENRDALRDCLGEDAFSDAFGLARRADLEEAIETEYAGAIRDDDKPCVGPAMLTHLGSVEAAAEVGLTVTSPNLLEDGRDIVIGASYGRLLEEIYACSTIRERIAEAERTSEPAYQECVVDIFENDNGWQRAEVGLALGSKLASVDWRRADALDSCVNEHIAEVYGDVDSFDLGLAHVFGGGQYEQNSLFDPDYDSYGRTEADLTCALVEVVTNVDIDRLSELNSTFDPDVFNQELNDLWYAYGRSLDAGFERCTDDALYLVFPDILRAGFQVDTIDCLRAGVGDLSDVTFYDPMFTALEFDVWNFEIDALIDRTRNLLESCSSADERPVFDAWSAWIDEPFVDPFLEGEPETLSA